MDEAWISTALGLPGWVLLLVLFIAAGGVLILTVRQHPKSRRVVPFSALLLGAGSGGLLWLLALGPALFGQQPDPWRLLPKPLVAPKVVALVPAKGAVDVAPGLAEIRVTFDRPMRDNSWAWCGGGPHFPERIGMPHYDSSRTVWSVSVKLKADWEYVFLLNSELYMNFVSEEGAALEPVLVRFRTTSAEGAP